MRGKVRSSLLALLSSISSLPGIARLLPEADAMKPVADVAADLAARAASFVRDQRVPGAAVGVVHGDELAWSAGVGSQM